MILADKIIELRKKNGWSQEDLAEMLDVSRQSVSKWESAQSVPDMNRILKLSEIFGVSTDFLLKDEMEMPQSSEYTATASASEDILPVRSVSMEEASAFMEHRDRASVRVSLGVMMCILSPVVLVLLLGLRDAGVVRIAENAAGGFGLIVLFLLVGGAVALFIINGLHGKRFEYLEEERIDTAYGVDSIVKDRREKYRQTYAVQLVTGIVLCVLCVIPIFAAVWIFADNEAAGIVSTAALLVMLAIGVMLIVRSGVIWDGFHILLQEGEHSVEQKEEDRKNQNLSTIYWCSATALYLALSFLTGEWHRTWILWPVAGAAYGIVTAVARVMRRQA
ncbi:MAG: helix-turn-helix transcriptional regulator [Lachnospiraceae bacterium]|nr:helix-turn-helix transcriptional regulator [Lachnospiraceae bacterium]